MRHPKYVGAEQSNMPTLQDAISVKVAPDNGKLCEL